MSEQEKVENVDKYKGLAEKLKSVNETPTTLEATFNIEAGSTPNFQDKVEKHLPVADTITDPQTGEIIIRETDATFEMIEKEERIEDLQIDGKLNEIYDNAVTAFNNHAGLAENADPRFSARNGEVAAQYLKLALDSTNAKVEAKYKRNKVRIAKLSAQVPNSVQNNLVVADRNDVLKSLFSQDFEKTIKEEFSRD